MGQQQCSSALPQVIDALYGIASTHYADDETTRVYDGEASSDDTGDFLMVGVEDPDSDSMSLTGETDQNWANLGYGPREETGSVTCAAVAWNGDGDQKRARDAAYAIVDVLAKAVGADPTLGVGEWMRGAGVSQTQLSQIAGGDGVMALVVFRVAYAARIYPPA